MHYLTVTINTVYWYDQEIVGDHFLDRLEKSINYLPDACPKLIKIIHRLKSPTNIIVTKWNGLCFRLFNDMRSTNWGSSNKLQLPIYLLEEDDWSETNDFHFYICFFLSFRLAGLLDCPFFIEIKVYDLNNNILKSHKRVRKSTLKTNRTISLEKKIFLSLPTSITIRKKFL